MSFPTDCVDFLGRRRRHYELDEIARQFQEQELPHVVKQAAQERFIGILPEAFSHQTCQVCRADGVDPSTRGPAARRRWRLAGVR
jgi:hypothetical protein